MQDEEFPLTTYKQSIKSQKKSLRKWYFHFVFTYKSTIYICCIVFFAASCSSKEADPPSVSNLFFSHFIYHMIVMRHDSAFFYSPKKSCLDGRGMTVVRLKFIVVWSRFLNFFVTQWILSTV